MDGQQQLEIEEGKCDNEKEETATRKKAMTTRGKGWWQQHDATIKVMLQQQSTMTLLSVEDGGDNGRDDDVDANDDN